jgi:signal transduction histidine kinase
MNAILEAQEEERKRISESLHNGVGQLLYATKLNLAQVNLDALPDSKAEAAQVLDTVEALLSDAIVETRRVSHQLMPFLLKDFGLQKAIEEFCGRFARTCITLDCHCFPERLSSALEMIIYRTSQELVNNIVKHSGATRAALEVTRDRHFVYIEVKDNGKGMERGSTDHDRPGKGIGLRSIQDRVALLGGSLEIESAPGKGTLITIRLPLTSGVQYPLP